MNNRFYDFISLKQYQVPTDERNRFLDNIQHSMELQKNEVELSNIKGLQIKSRASHAARLTGHWHYYNPYHMKFGADTFVRPYKKPVLTHHNEQSDPIGRVQVSNYISTPSPLIPKSAIDSAENTSELNKKNLSFIKTLKPFLYDKSFEGLGYLSLLKNVTDVDAIEKIIDGRYHTLSVGYSTNKLICSECFTDWLKEGPCEHQKGHNYGSGPMFLIFEYLEYGEVSYVDEPADSLAQNETVKRIIIPVTLAMADSIKKAKTTAEREAIVYSTMAKDSLLITNPERIAMTEMGLYLFNADSNEYIPQFTEQLNTNSGEKMKVKDLLDMKQEEVFEKLATHLQDGVTIDPEAISKLDDSQFLGRGRNLPVHNVDFASAVEKLLEEVEDSEEKQQLVDFLADRKSSFVVAEPTADSDNTEESTTEEEPTQDSAPAVVEKNTDFISYAFRLEGENWGLPDPENPNTEIEMNILELLLGMYARTDAMKLINSILEKAENKDELVKELSKDSVSAVETQVEELQGIVENYKKEQNTWKTTKDSLNNTILSLTEDLKDQYVEKIADFKQTNNPSVTKETVKDELKKQSLTELKATYTNFRTLLGGSDSNFIPAAEQNPTEKFEDNAQAITKEYVDNLEKEVEERYISLLESNSRSAKNYKVKMDSKIKSLREKIENKD